MNQDTTARRSAAFDHLTNYVSSPGSAHITRTDITRLALALIQISSAIKIASLTADAFNLPPGHPHETTQRLMLDAINDMNASIDDFVLALPVINGGENA